MIACMESNATAERRIADRIMKDVRMELESSRTPDDQADATMLLSRTIVGCTQAIVEAILRTQTSRVTR
jgi:hypothetical protein